MTQTAAAGLFAWYAPGFSDPIGDRLLLFDNTDGRPLELLRLSAPLAEVEDADVLLTERTRELSSLDGAQFARVCRVDRLPDPGGGLAIVSEHVEGQRLSEFLAVVRQRGGRLAPDLVLDVISKLVCSVSAIHRLGPHLAHGALAPERIVVAPGGAVVVTEQVLGSVLPHVTLDPAALWRQLRLPVRTVDESPAFDQCNDVFQVGLIALALLLGRPLDAGDYPAAVPRLLEEAGRVMRDAEWNTARRLQIEDWLARAMSFGSTSPFADGIAARQAFEQPVIRSRRGGRDGRPVRSLLQKPVHGKRSRWRSPRLAIATLVSVGLVGAYLATHLPRGATAGRPIPEAPSPVPAGRASIASGVSATGTRKAAAGTDLRRADRVPVESRRLDAGRRSGGLSVVSAVELQVYEDKRLVGTSASPRIDLEAGAHRVSLVNEAIGYRETRDVRVTAGRTATIEVSLPEGRADINAAPWAEVWIDGVKAGETPLARFPMTPGRHIVTFRHPRLGERSLECFVRLDQPLRLSANLGK